MAPVNSCLLPAITPLPPRPAGTPAEKQPVMRCKWHKGRRPPSRSRRKRRGSMGQPSRTSGIDWKELHAGIARVMQWFCSEYKTEKLLTMGLDSLNEIQERWVPDLYASDPHKLLRTMEDLSILNYAQAILQSSLARKASSKHLHFQRLDYPQLDPPEWNKFTTIKLENNKPISGERPLRYWGDLKQNYESHNRDYTGVWQG